MTVINLKIYNIQLFKITGTKIIQNAVTMKNSKKKML